MADLTLPAQLRRPRPHIHAAAVQRITAVRPIDTFARDRIWLRADSDITVTLDVGNEQLEDLVVDIMRHMSESRVRRIYERARFGDTAYDALRHD